MDWIAVAALVISAVALVYTAIAQVRTEQSLRTGFEVLLEPDPRAGPLEGNEGTFMTGSVRFRLRGPGVRYDVTPSVWGLGEAVTIFRYGYFRTRLSNETVQFCDALQARDAMRAVMRAEDDPVGFDYAVDVHGWNREAAWAGVTWTAPAAVRGFRRGGMRVKLRGKQERPQMWSDLLGVWVPVLPGVPKRGNPLDGAVFGRF